MPWARGAPQDSAEITCPFSVLSVMCRGFLIALPDKSEMKEDAEDNLAVTRCIQHACTVYVTNLRLKRAIFFRSPTKILVRHPVAAECAARARQRRREESKHRSGWNGVASSFFLPCFSNEYVPAYQQSISRARRTLPNAPWGSWEQVTLQKMPASQRMTYSSLWHP